MLRKSSEAGGTHPHVVPFTPPVRGHSQSNGAFSMWIPMADRETLAGDKYAAC